MKFQDKCRRCGKSFWNYYPIGYLKFCSVGCELAWLKVLEQETP